MANQASNRFKISLASKEVDLESDSFIVILMAAGFVFNKATHHKYSDVSANELATLNGYTQKDKALSLTAITENDTDGRCDVTFDPVAWTADGGNIGPASGAIIIDDTHANDIIVGYIDFGGNYTQIDGGTATLTGLEVRIS
jgi:hypothetical protein